MSKLPKAPLIEVIFELRWQIKEKSDLTKYQYLIGDLYSKISDRFPYRESLVPPEIPSDILINKPAHRFRAGQNKYPLVQIGPGLITLNTIDDNYYWEEFYDWSNKLLSDFMEVFSFDSETFTPSLIYLDFFRFDFNSDNVNDYLNNQFNLTIDQSFLKDTGNPYNLNIGYYYNTELGKLDVLFKRGQNSKKEEGVLVTNGLKSNTSMSEKSEILDWLNKAHAFSSQLFKDITAGELYDSFK
ncbi:TIGR04255 family protein [Robiginitalea sp. IMCC44478]|uniref:TIGR04255 family protein n=1 Tax=Robiginitalea sp. IMCC44478 TaxID=3459122 RepID=UPI0040427533